MVPWVVAVVGAGGHGWQVVLVGVDGLCVLGYGKCRADTGYIALILLATISLLGVMVNVATISKFGNWFNPCSVHFIFLN